jgi:hypothetical protein
MEKNFREQKKNSVIKELEVITRELKYLKNKHAMNTSLLSFDIIEGSIENILLYLDKPK